MSGISDKGKAVLCCQQHANSNRKCVGYHTGERNFVLSTACCLKQELSGISYRFKEICVDNIMLIESVNEWDIRQGNMGIVLSTAC
jgi:hypothetical protein